MLDCSIDMLKSSIATLLDCHVEIFTMPFSSIRLDCCVEILDNNDKKGEHREPVAKFDIIPDC